MDKIRYFAFSDVHGCYQELIDALDNAGYDIDNPHHKLLFLGDAFDKNKDDYHMYVFLRDNIRNHKLIWIMGNHDYYLLNVLRKKQINKSCSNTVKNIALGLNKELKDYDGYIDALLKDGLYKILSEDTRYYFETEKYVFTHAFIPYDKKNNRYDSNWREADEKRWNTCLNNLINFRLAIKYHLLVPGKTLVLGHIGAYYGNITKYHPDLEIDGEEFKALGDKIKRKPKENIRYFQTFYGEGVIGLDARSFDTGLVNVFAFEEEEINGQ
ncbi:MAG: metallophosphoesterase [Bacilli bacterium]|nr:metallophosphoesterase [Bacilli bacterium]